MSRLREFETYAVLLTPPGRGAVALIGLSGPAAAAVLGRLLESGAPPVAGRMRHVWLRNAAGERLDDALVVGLPPEAAVSGGPAWELGVHGGPAVVGAVFAALEAAGARRGEWKHLLEAGRCRGALDPIRAAALRRVGRVVSRRGAEVLAFALTGALQAAIQAAVTAADPGALQALDRAGRRARAWLEPLRVTLVGPPNAGKSTLFNAILGWNRATVSGEAGTTRDAVEEDVLVDDEPIRLVDTAGQAGDAAIGEGVHRSAVALLIEDGADPDSRLAAAAAGRKHCVRVVNKTDRMSASERAGIPSGVVGVSARDGEGLAALMRAIRATVGRETSVEARETPLPAPFTGTDRRLIGRAIGSGPAPEAARRALMLRCGSGPE